MNYLLIGILILLVTFAIFLLLKILKKTNDAIITEEDILNVILIMTVDTEVPKGLFIQMTDWYSTQRITTILSNKYIREN